jgi:hypothetical protein
VKIEIAGGSLIAIEQTRVDTIYTAVSKPSTGFTFSQNVNGYFNVTTLGILFTGRQSDYYYYNNGSAVSGLSLQFVNGYRFNTHYLIGGGAGIDVIEHPLVQLYAQGRYELLKQQSTPFCFAEGGYSFDLKADEEQDWQSIHYTGGWFYGAGAGMRFNFRHSGAFTLDAQYKLIRRDEEVNYEGGDYFVNQFALSRVIIRAGIAF